MKNSKRQFIIGGSIVFLITMILLGLTYAYYRTRVIGNQNERSISATIKNPKIDVIYSDDSNVISINKVFPGTTVSKTFKVTNKQDNTDVEYFSIKLDNIVNTCMRKKDWTFILMKDDTIISKGFFPTGTIYIANSLSIEKGQSEEYTLVISYAKSDEDQSIDMQNKVKLRINIDYPVEKYFPMATEGSLLEAIERDNFLVEPATDFGYKSPVRYINKEYAYASLKQGVSLIKNNNYYTYSSSYEFNERTGTYRLIDPKVGKGSDGVCEDCYLTLLNQSSSSVYNSVRKLYKVIEKVGLSFKYSEVESELVNDETAFYYINDNYGKSYYYRGGTKNNYVNFSGMCWRIVRVQGDGTIKAILGNEKYECNSSSDDDAYNVNAAFIHEGSSPKRIKYKETLTNVTEDLVYENSDIVNFLNDWESQKISDTSVLTDTEWCSRVKKMNVENNWEYFETYLRVNSTSPSVNLECPNQSFRSNIGILTSDEVVLAGATRPYGDSYEPWDSGYYLMDNTNSSSYYSYWTMSPMGIKGSNGYQISVSAWGWLDPMTDYPLSSSNATAAVRPVIVFKSDAKISGGDGTQSNPYVIVSN